MKTLLRFLAMAAVVAGFQLFAQDDVSDVKDTGLVEGNAPASEGEETAGSEGELAPPGADHKHFHTLPSCSRLEGLGDVLRPGARDWAPIEEGMHYPLGTAFRTVGKDSRLKIAFGRDSFVYIVGEASFGTRSQPVGEKSRAITLRSGVITLRLPRNMPEGLFSVSAPGFTVVNPAGDSRYRYSKTGDGDEATVRCVTGTLGIKGRHFEILSMRAANEVKIRTSQDALFTGIYGTRGTYSSKLEQGLALIKDVETGDSHTEAKFLEWKISPLTAVRIHRAVPNLGQNMAVTVMTFDAAGQLKNRCAFTENRFEINSGEIAPAAKGNNDALAKKAAEAAKTEAAAAETTEAVEAEASVEAPADDLELEF
jgi:hypothetical protein